MEHFCSYQERCKMDVVQKMKQLGVPSQFYDDVLAHLQAIDFLNEARFAKEYTLGKFTLKKWGRCKIYHHLQSKGIDTKTTVAALKIIDVKAYMTALKMLVAQKMEGATFGDLYAREKCISAMMAKGYEYDLIAEVFLQLKKTKPLKNKC